MNVLYVGNILKYTDLETDLRYEGDRNYLFLNCESLKHLYNISEEHNLG